MALLRENPSFVIISHSQVTLCQGGSVCLWSLCVFAVKLQKCFADKEKLSRLFSMTEADNDRIFLFVGGGVKCSL